MINFNGFVLSRKCFYGIIAIIVLIVFALIATGGTYGYKFIKDYRDKDAALRVYEAEYKMLLQSIEKKKAEKKNIRPPKDVLETKARLKELGYEVR